MTLEHIELEQKQTGTHRLGNDQLRKRKYVYNHTNIHKIFYALSNTCLTAGVTVLVRIF